MRYFVVGLRPKYNASLSLEYGAIPEAMIIRINEDDEVALRSFRKLSEHVWQSAKSILADEAPDIDLPDIEADIPYTEVEFPKEYVELEFEINEADATPEFISAIQEPGNATEITHNDLNVLDLVVDGYRSTRPTIFERPVIVRLVFRITTSGKIYPEVTIGVKESPQITAVLDSPQIIDMNIFESPVHTWLREDSE